MNIRDPHESFSVADYIREAKRVEREIRERGNRPLFTGGTGMYLDRLLNGLFEGPEADWDLRNRLKEEAEEIGRQALHDRLARVDPERADEIHPNDRRRVIRALEVYEKTGRPMSELQKEARREAETYEHRVVLLKWPRDVLYRRIEERVEHMMDRGWVKEAKALKGLHPPPGKHVMQAVGYREIFKYLEGELEYAEMVAEIKQAHRNLAKRQLTWFRNLDHPVREVDLSDETDMDEIVECVKAELQKSNSDE